MLQPATRSPFVATLLVPVMLHCDVAMRGQMLDVPARSDDCVHSMNGAPSKQIEIQGTSEQC